MTASATAATTTPYPAGWPQAGGALRSYRSPLRTRHVPDATGFGGYHLPTNNPAGELDTDVDAAQVELGVRAGDSTQFKPELAAAG